MAKRSDPYRNFRFLVEIDNVVQQDLRTAAALIQRGSDRVPRRRTICHRTQAARQDQFIPDITSNGGLTDSRDLYDWHLAVIKGESDRRNGSIIQLDDQGVEKVRLEFFRCLAEQYDGPDFSGKGNDIS